ncbi:MAG: LysR family transcriptional regulator [Defluviimonas sp.]|uniref:LysR family transcriptional regulator n=1 Tax=Albidovulum sp. TaxID=1872424 RepID=UPI001DE8091B|nr:LysR family transcriptional regulator [Paracoccaceae bacterium]MCC0062879.1 LysR family transcriptional regulator [Defluviimonas sp.]
MIDKLEMFLAVAKEEHFGRAAESLGIAQPTLSAGIRQLEYQLGVQLIFRGSRFGGLTPEGQRALVWARQIVADANQLREEMRFSHAGLTGHLRLATIPTALTWAAKLTAGFGEKHPNVRFTVLSRTSVEILSMLENLNIDAGISYLDNEPTGRLSAELLYNERYHLVCSETSPFAARASIEWKELGAARLCLLTPDMQNRRIINRHFEEAGIRPEARIESNSTVVLAANVMSGDWVTVLPADIANFLTAGKALRTVPLAGTGATHAVGLLAPNREPHTPVLRALLSEARRLAQR